MPSPRHGQAGERDDIPGNNPGLQGVPVSPLYEPRLRPRPLRGCAGTHDLLFENSIVCLVVFVCCFFGHALFVFPFGGVVVFCDASFWFFVFVIGFF